MSNQNSFLNKPAVRSTLCYVTVFARWALFAGIVGAVCGAAGALFHHAVDYATEIRTEYAWVLFLLPVAGLAIVALYHAAGMQNDRGTNLILSSIYTDERPPLRMAPLIFIATTLTHLCGGSAGREGAALQIGGSLGAYVAKLFRLSEKDATTFILCGMSGLFSALFSTPLTAAVFSLEVISMGMVQSVALLPCMFSSIIAYLVAGKLGVVPVTYSLLGIPTAGAGSFLQVVALGALCALVGILFCSMMHTAGHLYKKYLRNAYLRVFVGGLLVVGFTLLVGSRDYNGAGMNVVANALAGSARPEAFFLKLLFTALSLGAGFKGGEIVPTFFVGSTFGCVAAPLLGLDPAFGAAIGLVATFCAVVNCPIASILLSVELFGSAGFMFFGLACAVSYLLSGPHSLYSNQLTLFPRLEIRYHTEQPAPIEK